MSRPDRPAREARLAALWTRPGPAVMGILNVTPDSFSDGGRHASAELAVDHGDELVAAGAAIVDVGGESTRPGAAPVAAALETARVAPVVTELRRRHPATLLSVDTSKTVVAAAALAAGADVVNDVAAGAAPGLLELVAAAGAAVVLMHRRGTPATMQVDTSYHHVVAEVHAFLAERAQAALAAGVAADHVWLDPGIGFGKDDAGNLALLAALPELAALGFPVLVGASRKAFIGRLAGAAVGDRLPGTLAALVPAVGLPRAVVRVHDPGPVLQFLTVLRRTRAAA